MSRSSITLSGFEIAEAPLDVDIALVAESSWIPAIVPGGVHESLLAAGLIEHPYRDENEASIRWIEERDWWYRTRFDGPSELAADERVRLVFHGLDTVADVWLNGRHVGGHENMFRPADFDVTAVLQPVNEILVRFRPPLAGLDVPPQATALFTRLAAVLAAMSGRRSKDAAPQANTGGGTFISEMLPLATLRRKAAFSWGWDFGPRAPSIGIWRPVELRRERIATITGHHIRTEAIEPDGTALVTVLVEVEDFSPTPSLQASVSLVSPRGARHDVSLPVVDGRARGLLRIADAELWWSHDLGEPSLYDVTVVLVAGGVEVDALSDRVGIRRIELDRSDDPEGGRRFGFVLNGVPIFARGAAWLPADMLVGSVSAERHRELVGLARDGGMNMLRIWGGGIYEHDAFYSACDELGVLIWHDFMFACVDYPSADPKLAAEVAAEAEYQVRRLRNRASMALWAGNNEVHVLHGYAYQNHDPGDWGWHFFHDILPRAVAEHGGGVPYWPGSPWGDSPEEGFLAINGVRDGDRHAWEVWHGMDVGAGGGDYASAGEARHYRRYANDTGKFISEFGIHASPELSTLERWITPAELDVHSPTMDAHNKDHPKNKGDAIMEIITGLPQSMPQYVDFTMVTQAEGLKFGIEHYRRRQPSNNGTLVWQFNDVWPGFSWSVVDYEGVPKAGYWYARRAYAPVLASFRQVGDGLELWICNSTASLVTTTARVSVSPFEGRGKGETVAATVEPRSASLVWRTEGPFSEDRFAWVESVDGAFPENRLFFAEIKDLPFSEQALEVTITDAGDGEAVVDIAAEHFAYFVHLPTPAPGVRFSDNYVDLRAGTSRRIHVTGLPSGFGADDLRVETYAGMPNRS
ncbi:glycoside hydrolase family 2 protein [Sphaerisporangium sp. NPDC051017]|uniref:glycoside hydrolase family 2 protein n=1 Tax=Sphaerisporangium sp. NPDC051017 TaxID=3154636 RepID=UPI003439CD7A